MTTTVTARHPAGAGTRAGGAEPAAAGRAAAVSLATLVDALGEGLVRIVTAPRGLDVAVDEIVVHDPLGEPTPGPDDVLLAVGVDPHRPSALDLVSTCGERGAAAVVLKDDGLVPASLASAAESVGLALLLAPAAAAWGQLHTLLRTATSLHPARPAGPGGAPLGDLFALADALASAVGGAVTIEDERARVLAYSKGPHPTDEARRATILGRQVPTEWVERLQDMGVTRHLASSDEVLHVDPLDDLAHARRLVVGVRAGGEALGSIWVQEGDRPFGPDADDALREASSIAALHLLRARSGEDLERRRSGDQLRAVLAGRLPASVLADKLQAGPQAPIVLLGLELAESDPTDAEVVADRIADSLVFSCAAFRRKVVAAGVGRTAFAVLAARGGADEARALALDLADRVGGGLRLGVRAAVADCPAGLTALTTAHADVALALRVQAARSAGFAVHVEDVRAATVLLQLADLAGERPGLLAGKVQLLEASDRERSTDYVETLRAYLDAFGDVRAAAQSVGVHPNTFRYRLRRLSELAQLDLDDTQQRLVAQLQLHLIGPRTWEARP